MLNASWDAPQQQKPIAAKLRDGSGSPDPALSVGFIKQTGFEPNLKGREGVCLPNPKWELVPQT